jgi:hypothetical protein
MHSADSVLATEYGCRIWLKHIPLSTYTNIHSTYKMVVFPQTNSVLYVLYPENTFRSKNGTCRTQGTTARNAPEVRHYIPKLQQRYNVSSSRTSNQSRIPTEFKHITRQSSVKNKLIKNNLFKLFEEHYCKTCPSRLSSRTALCRTGRSWLREAM